jgi:hypothetical protein
MYPAKPFQSRVFLLLSVLLSAAGLSGCPQKSRIVPPPSLTQEEEMQNPEINRLYLDISYVQDAERHDPMVGGRTPNEPITYGFGTDSLHHRSYRFANLRALRIDIRRRMDSLRRAGLVLRYDTAVRESGPVGKMKVDY